MKYEEILKEMETLSSKLESGKLSFDESITAFEHCVDLSKLALEKIKEGEGKITLLKEELGKIVSTDFSDKE